MTSPEDVEDVVPGVVAAGLLVGLGTLLRPERF